MRHLVALAFLAAAAAQPPYFADTRKGSFPLVDANTLEIFVADLNGDGRLDLVPGCYSSAPYHPGAPSVYWARGHGRFAAGETYYVALTNHTGLGDLDGDGDVDIVTAQGALRNDGQERFTAVQTAWSNVPGYTDNDRFAVGDVDGDGRVDVCTGHSVGRLWRNLGGLAFTDATAQVPPAMTGTPTFADLDGDGDLDLLAFRPPEVAPPRLALNDGRGVFTMVPAALFSAPAREVHDVAAADFDGDGRPDVALVGPEGPVLLRNLGGGRFADETNRLNTRPPALAVAAGDVDGDRDIDLVFGGGVHINQGGSFAWTASAWRPAPGPILDLVLFDGDGDGDLDLVEARAREVAGRYGYGLPDHIAWNDGRGRFRPGVAAPIPATVQGKFAALGDLDGDGAPDLILGDGGVRFLRGDGRGGFAPPVSQDDSVRGRPQLGDIDRDGDLDLVLVDALGFHVLRNPGNGLVQFASSIAYRGLAPGSAGTDGVLGDFDGDGALDLMVATIGPPRLPPGNFDPEVELLYLGDGRGGFGPAPLPLAARTGAFHIAAGDVDGDGRLDVAIDGLVIHRNTPTGFRTERYTNWYGGFGPIAFADLDRDGHLDLVCGNGCYPAWYSCNRHTDSPPESVVWNDGRGGFPAEQVLPTPLSNTRATAVGDVDEDGDVDVVYGNIDYPNTPIDQLVLNDGGRAFRNVFYSLPPDAFPLDTGDTRDLFLADLDFDGDLDLVAIDDTPTDTGLPVSRVYANLKRHLRTPDLARLGLPYRIWLEGASQGAVLLLAAGPGRIATPFGRLGLDPATMVVAATFGPPVQGRRAGSDPTIPADPGLLDATLWWQGAVLDASRLRLTNVVADQIGW